MPIGSTMIELPPDVPAELHEAWLRHPEIVKLGHPILTQVAKPVLHFNAETSELIDFMIKTMHKAHGLGLAAPQVGVSTRIFVYDSGDGIRVLVNPKILSRKGEQVGEEGCLSIPGLQGQVPRAKEVRVKAYDRNGRPITRRAADMEARVIQHELDHLDGILFIQHALPDTIEWLIGRGEDGDGNEAPHE